MSIVFTSTSSPIVSPERLLRTLLPFRSQSLDPELHFILSPDSMVLTIFPTPVPVNPDIALIPSLARALIYFGYDTISVSFLPSESEPSVPPMYMIPPLVDHSIVYDISDYFSVNFPDVVLLQGQKSKKNPILYHKGVALEGLRASWNESQKKLPSDVLICLRAQPGSPRLIVVDVDSHELAAFLTDMFPSLSLAPRQKTRKGLHFFFRADESLVPRLTDCASQVSNVFLRRAHKISDIRDLCLCNRSFRDPTILRALEQSRKVLGEPTRSTSRP